MKNFSTRVIVKWRDITYDLELKRKFTIIQGDSGTGKSALLGLIEAIKKQNATKNIISEYPVEIAPTMLTGARSSAKNKHLDDEAYKQRLKDDGEYHKIYLVDEDYVGLQSVDFARFVKNAECYFIIIARNALSMIPYSMTEIYTLSRYKKTLILKPVYTKHLELKSNYDCIITEDKRSDNQFLKLIYNNVISASGKTNLSDTLLKEFKNDNSKKFLIVLDSAAFGPDIDDLYKIINDNDINCDLFTPESFEWLICSSGIIDSAKIDVAVKDPYDVIDPFCNSWEQFYESILVSETKGLKNVYSKDRLNLCYYRPCCYKDTEEFHCNVKQGINKIDSIIGRFMIDKQQDMNLF